jgi:Delta3-Delta2-enoyl-CoA isomerase
VEGVRIERQGNLAVLRLDKARGNAIDATLIDSLGQAAGELAGDDGVRGVLLASAHPKVFSPGLDLVTLVEYDRERLRGFMGRFAETMWALYDLPKPVVAAVGGHAIAGGCILALTADLRVLRRGAQIGLNEVRIGVPLPWSVALLLRATVAATALAPVALLGRNFSDEEALSVGLADFVADGEGFELACLGRLQEFAEKDTHAFATTKRYLRSDVLRAMKEREAEALGEWLDGWFSPPTQARIRETVASLSRPR